MSNTEDWDDLEEEYEEYITTIASEVVSSEEPLIFEDINTANDVYVAISTTMEYKEKVLHGCTVMLNKSNENYPIVQFKKHKKC